MVLREPSSRRLSFTEMAHERGFRPSSDLLERHERPATLDEEARRCTFLLNLRVGGAILEPPKSRLPKTQPAPLRHQPLPRPSAEASPCQVTADLTCSSRLRAVTRLHMVSLPGCRWRSRRASHLDSCATAKLWSCSIPWQSGTSRHEMRRGH